MNEAENPQPRGNGTPETQYVIWKKDIIYLYNISQFNLQFKKKKDTKQDKQGSHK